MNKQGLFFRGFLAVLFSQFLLQQSSTLSAMQIPAPAQQALAKAGEAVVAFVKDPATVVLATTFVGTEFKKVGEQLIDALNSGEIGKNPDLSNVTINGQSASLTHNVESVDLLRGAEDFLVGPGTTTITRSDVAVGKTNITSVQVTASTQGAKTAPIGEGVAHGADQTLGVNQQDVQGNIGTGTLKRCPDLTAQRVFTLPQAPTGKIPGVFDNVQVTATYGSCNTTSFVDQSPLYVSSSGKPSDHNILDRNAYNYYLTFTIPVWQEQFKEWKYTSAEQAIDLRVFLAFGNYVGAMKRFFPDYAQAIAAQNPSAHHYRRIIYWSLRKMGERVLFASKSWRKQHAILLRFLDLYFCHCLDEACHQE